MVVFFLAIEDVKELFENILFLKVIVLMTCLYNILCDESDKF